MTPRSRVVASDNQLLPGQALDRPIARAGRGSRVRDGRGLHRHDPREQRRGLLLQGRHPNAPSSTRSRRSAGTWRTGRSSTWKLWATSTTHSGKTTGTTGRSRRS